MVDPRIAKLAKVLVHYSLKIRPDDLFRISGPALAAPLIGEVYREALAAGAHPFVRVSLEGLEEIYFKGASDEQLRFISGLQRLQADLSDTENKIMYSRQFYNDTVMQYDNMREAFPTNFVARMAGFGPKEYFEAEATSREPVKVQF